MNKTILQTHIDLLKECKRQNQMLEKLIELNMNDLHEVVEQRDKYKIGHDRYEKLRRLNLREMKELYLKHSHTLEHFDTLVDKLCQVK
jgi:hypothetical protein